MSRHTTLLETEAFGMPLYLWKSKQMEASGAAAGADCLMRVGLDPRGMTLVTDFDHATARIYRRRCDEEISTAHTAAMAAKLTEVDVPQQVLDAVAEVHEGDVAGMAASILKLGRTACLELLQPENRGALEGTIAELSSRSDGVSCPGPRPWPQQEWGGQTIPMTGAQVRENRNTARGFDADSTKQYVVELPAGASEEPKPWYPHKWRDDVDPDQPVPSCELTNRNCTSHSLKNGNGDSRKLAKNQLAGHPWKSEHSQTCDSSAPEHVMMDYVENASSTHFKTLMSAARSGRFTPATCKDQASTTSSIEAWKTGDFPRVMAHIANDHKDCVCLCDEEGEPDCRANPKPATRTRNCTCPPQLRALTEMYQIRLCDNIEKMVQVSVGLVSTSYMEALNTIDTFWASKSRHITAFGYSFQMYLSDFQANERFLLRAHKLGWISGYRHWAEWLSREVESSLGVPEFTLLTKQGGDNLAALATTRTQKSDYAKQSQSKVKKAQTAARRRQTAIDEEQNKLDIAKATGQVKPSEEYKSRQLETEPTVCRAGCGKVGCHASRKSAKCFFYKGAREWKWPRNRPPPPGFSFTEDGKGPPRGPNPWTNHLAGVDDRPEAPAGPVNMTDGQRVGRATSHSPHEGKGKAPKAKKKSKSKPKKKSTSSKREAAGLTPQRPTRPEAAGAKTTGTRKGKRTRNPSALRWG